MSSLTSTLPASKARSNFYSILSEATNHLRQFEITQRGKKSAVIMAAEEFESWLETLDVVSDTKLMKEIEIGLSQIRLGKAVEETEANQIIGW